MTTDTNSHAGKADGAPITMRPLGTTGIPDIVGAIGTPEFETRMLELLTNICGADHFGVFGLAPDNVRMIGVDPSEHAHTQSAIYESRMLWRQDPVVREALGPGRQCGTNLIQVDMDQMPDSGLRTLVYPRIRERLFISSARGSEAYGLSVLRSKHCTRISRKQVALLAQSADIILSTIARHYEGLDDGPRLADSLNCLASIEKRIRRVARFLPPREIDVCARFLYGMTSVGIALDLGIGEESIKTYRKRLYKRLGIGSPRELIMWYLKLPGGCTLARDR